MARQSGMCHSAKLVHGQCMHVFQVDKAGGVDYSADGSLSTEHVRLVVLRCIDRYYKHYVPHFFSSVVTVIPSDV
jgi:hypothetical protein